MAIYLPFKKLTHWQKIVFGAALLERMLPNYQLFSEAESFGDAKLLRNQLDLIWQWLDKNNRCKINYTAQLEKLEANIPNPEHFDSFGVFPALDVCMALMSLLQTMQDSESDGCENVSKLSYNSVSYYVELLLAQELDDGQVADDRGIAEAEIKAHPLMQWELACQNELFDFLKTAPENQKACRHAKQLMLEEGLSNLGIEIELN